MNNHTASLEIPVNVHESVLSRKLVFWTSNCKHVIKYDFYVKCSRIFAHNVQTCAKFCCKNFSDVCQVFEYYTIILGGAFFCGYAVLWLTIQLSVALSFGVMGLLTIALFKIYCGVCFERIFEIAEHLAKLWGKSLFLKCSVHCGTVLLKDEERAWDLMYSRQELF